MANRVGKYKLSKKETELSLADGGNVNGLDLEKSLAFAGGYDPAG